jgi:DegT/DnrJ/EryC1/StrS aminotransferase family
MRFLMPVDLYGQLADMHALSWLGLPIVDDACQVHRAGATGCARAQRVSPVRQLQPREEPQRPRGRRRSRNGRRGAGVVRQGTPQHGQRAKYRHELEGYTARLDTIQALVLVRKLPLLEGWNEARRDAASLYTSALDGIGDLVLPPLPDGSEPVWHVDVVRTGANSQARLVVSSPVTLPIPDTTNAAQLEENLAALDIDLDENDIAELGDVRLEGIAACRRRARGAARVAATGIARRAGHTFWATRWRHYAAYRYNAVPASRQTHSGDLRMTAAAMLDWRAKPLRAGRPSTEYTSDSSFPPHRLLNL